jgi:PAS domain S-box-containing protein
MDFQKLFVHIPEPVVVVSPAYKILTATDAYLQVTMRSREELIGKDFLSLFPDNPDTSASRNEKLLRQSLDNALQSKKVDYLDVLRYDIPRPEDQGGGFDVRYWEASHTPVLDNKGNVEFIIQRTNDVTEREITKLALSESNEKFRFMAEAMPQLIFTTNATGELTYLNQRWATYTGLPIKELVYNGIQQVLHPEDAENYNMRLQQAYATNSELQMELRIKATEGDYRWHLVRVLPQVHEDGQLMMWVGTITEVHGSKQMVEELLESNLQMSELSDQVQLAYKKAESERQILERLIMESPAIFCILEGPEHRFKMMNDNYKKLFPGRDLIDKTLSEAMPEVAEQGFVGLLDNVYQTGESYISPRSCVMIDKYDNGELEPYTVAFHYQPLFDENETIYGILVFGYELPVEEKQQLS